MFGRMVGGHNQGEANLARRLTLAYVVALSLIALLSGAIHLLLDRVILENGDSASVINVAGRQRMLSQRIGLYALMYSQDPQDQTRVVLIDAIALMEKSHSAILFGDLSMGLTGVMSPAARALYTQDPWQLDQKTREFLAAARAVVAQRDSGALPAVLRGAGADLVVGLDHAVKTFETEANQRIATLRRSQQVVLAVLLLTLMAEAIFIFHPLVRLVRDSASRVIQMATRDSLTGLINRGHFFDLAQRTLAMAYRKKQPLSVLMIDIDHFKAINDNGGNAVGDAVLRHFAKVVIKTLRVSDVIGRVGSKEFAVLLPDTSPASALTVTEKLRSAVSASPLDRLPAYTFSAGIATWNDQDPDIISVIKRADDALYQAKQGGSNQVMMAI